MAKLNSCMVIGTRQQLCKLQPISISVNNYVISPSPHIKNLCSWLDSNLNMTTHITPTQGFVSGPIL
jgi:hypothetical protein